MTRGYLAIGTKAFSHDQVLLPIGSDKPDFDKRGDTGDYPLAKHDAPNWIKWIIAISFASILFVASLLLCPFLNRMASSDLSFHDFSFALSKCATIYNSITITITGGVVMLIKQEADDKDFVSNAEKEWEKEIKNYDNS